MLTGGDQCGYGPRNRLAYWEMQPPKKSLNLHSYLCLKPVPNSYLKLKTINMDNRNIVNVFNFAEPL